MVKEKIPIGYMCVWTKALSESRNRIISRKKLKAILKQSYRIPNNLMRPTLKELQDLNLIGVEDKNNFKVLDCGIDLENTSKIYRDAGLN